MTPWQPSGIGLADMGKLLTTIDEAGTFRRVERSLPRSRRSVNVRSRTAAKNGVSATLPTARPARLHEFVTQLAVRWAPAGLRRPASAAVRFPRRARGGPR